MCMCGGILEVGAVCALIGWVGKKLHKCDCDCHKKEHVHECNHCKDYKENECEKNCMIKKEKMKKRYKAIQIALAVITTIGMMMIAYGVYKVVEEYHCEQCEQEHCEHHK